MIHILKLLSLFPLRWMQRLGAGVGWLVWWSSAQYRNQFLSNTAAAGLGWRETRGAVRAAGQLLGEIPWLWTRNQEHGAMQRGALDDVQFIEHALKNKRGVIFLSPHIGCWEMGAQLLGEFFGPKYGDVIALYRPARKAWVEALVSHFRGREHLRFVPTTLSGVRALLRQLKSGGCVAILPDQVPPSGMGVWAPFFGRPVYTMTLLPKLAQQTGALVVLAWCERLPGARYVCHFKDLSDYDLGNSQRNIEALCEQMNRAVESLILEAPDQYLWGYNRSKQPREMPAQRSDGDKTVHPSGD